MYEKEQKEIIYKMLNYFKDKKLNIKDKKSIAKLDRLVKKILTMEVENLGYDNTPDFEILKIDDPSSNALASVIWSYPATKVVNNKNNAEQKKSSHTSSSNNNLPQSTKPSFTINYSLLYKPLTDSSIHNRLLGCISIFTTLFHEVRHFEQNLIIRDENVPSSKLNLAFSMDYSLLENLTNNDSDFYEANYDAYTIENDAFLREVQRYFEIMGEDDYFTQQYNIYNSSLYNGIYEFPSKYQLSFYNIDLPPSLTLDDGYTVKIYPSGNPNDKDFDMDISADYLIHKLSQKNINPKDPNLNDIIKDLIDEICIEIYSKLGVDPIIGEKNDISTHILNMLINNTNNSLLDEFPIFKRIYKEKDDGTYSPKSAVELFKQMWKELNTINYNTNLSDTEKSKLSKDCKHMYFELLYNSLSPSSPELGKSSSIDFTIIDDTEHALGRNNFIKLLKHMKKYFYEKASKSIDQIDKEHVSIMKLDKYYEFNDSIDTDCACDYFEFKRKFTDYFNDKLDFLNDIINLYKEEPQLADEGFEIGDD